MCPIGPNEHDDVALAAAITISHFRPAGAAWGRNLVLVVFTVL